MTVEEKLAERMCLVAGLAWRLSQEAEWLDAEDKARIRPIADELAVLAAPPAELSVIAGAAYDIPSFLRGA